MRALSRTARTLAVVPVLSAALLGGCGNTEDERQDANDRSQTFAVEVVRASFPERQTVGTGVTLQIDVRNTGTETIPNLAISLDGLRRVREQADLADPKRPVWIIDEEPKAGVTAYVDTWAAGPLKAGQTRRHRWEVTPTRAGNAVLRWSIAGSLTGGARVQRQGGEPAEGAFNVKVRASDADSAGRVDPATGALSEPAATETTTTSR